MRISEMGKAAVLAIAALAFTASAGMARGAASNDRIVLELATEGWVETETAQVVASVNATLNENQASDVRQNILDTLKTLADADWRITSFNRSADQSGLDSWSVQAQARIADTDLDGLRQAAKDKSKPGMAISISGIDFTPTLAEVENTRAKLRQDVYKQATAELERVNAAFPDANYHVGMVNFTGRPVAPAAPREAFMARSAAADSAPKQQNIQVQDRIQLQATVVLMTESEQADSGE